MSVKIDCYYCEGRGYGTEEHWNFYGDHNRTSIHECNECCGTGFSCRKAGDRYTGPKWAEDHLIAMTSSRARLLAARQVREMPWPSNSEYLNAKHHYDMSRLRAMRPCSRLKQADMLAMSKRCVNRVDTMRIAK